MKQHNASIIILAKNPVPGQVKTRLIPVLGASGAAELQSKLIHQTLTTAITSQCGPVELWCSPTYQHSFFSDCCERYPITLHQQKGADLGKKMALAAQAGLSRSHAVIIIGTDCPTLHTDDLNAALKKLEQGNELCLKPAEDGGYVLVAMRRLIKSIFEDMPWGTRDVLAKTRHRLMMQSIKHAELDITWDLDRPGDYDRYCKLKDISYDKQTKLGETLASTASN